MIRPLVVMPDPRLHEVCRPVAKDEDVSAVIRDLFDTAKSLTELDGKPAQCVGLAAPQLGYMVRVIVVCVRGQESSLENPEIVRRQGRPVPSKEGCWSEPGVTGEILRFPDVTVKHRGGRSRYCGLAAFVVQHELDHLDGKLLSDRFGVPAPSAKKVMVAAI